MALKITLKPNERMIIGGAVIQNGDTKCELLIENTVTLLREKDIMKEEEANSPSRSIYFTIQLMYIDRESLATYHNTYWNLVRELVDAAPTTLGLIDRINEKIISNQYYQALKIAKELIDYEQEVISRA
jgi:flagellar protein FlbT